VAELRLATRKSPLARWQAQWVAQLLDQAGVSTRLVFVTTRGDRQQSTSIARLGAQGVFTREIQQAVLDGRADAAVREALARIDDAATHQAVLAAVAPPR